MRSPLPLFQNPPQRQPITSWQLQQRATLEGLEVSDSTWEEWEACVRRQALRQAQAQQAAANKAQ